jgi:hypothetical protein
MVLRSGPGSGAVATFPSAPLRAAIRRDPPRARTGRPIYKKMQLQFVLSQLPGSCVQAGSKVRTKICAPGLPPVDKYTAVFSIIANDCFLALLISEAEAKFASGSHVTIEQDFKYSG